MVKVVSKPTSAVGSISMRSSPSIRMNRAEFEGAQVWPKVSPTAMPKSDIEPPSTTSESTRSSIRFPSLSRTKGLRKSKTHSD